MSFSPRHNQQSVDRMRRLYGTHGSHRAVADIMRIAPNTVRYYRRRGWAAPKDPRILPVPSDYAIVRPDLTIAEARRHYGRTQGVIQRWDRESGATREKPSARVYECMPVPDDLAEVVAREGVAEAAKHFGVCPTTLRRWRRAAGLPIAPARIKRVAVSHVGWVDRYSAERLAA